MSNLSIQNTTNENVTANILNDQTCSTIVNLGVRDDQTVFHPVPVGANIVLSDAELLYSVRQSLIVNATGMTAARSLTLGADTPARAKQLQDLFGITRTGGNVVMKLHLYGTQAAFALNLANTSGTANNVRVTLNGGGAASTQILSVVSAVGALGDMVVWVIGDNITPGAEVITFNIIQQGLATAP